MTGDGRGGERSDGEPTNVRDRTWPAAKETLRELDPAFVERYETLAGHPMEDGPLDEETTELVALATHAACTTTYGPETRRFIGRSLDAGASVREVLGVLEMISAIGVHAVTEGVPVLVDEAGLPEDTPEAERVEQGRLQERFVEKRGYWDELWDQVLQIDHEYFGAYLEFSAHPTEVEFLDPIQREFVIIAVDASTNHLYLPGLRIHIRNALEYGATREEIMAVIEIASTVGVNAISNGLPILLEEAGKRNLLENA